MKPRYCEYCKKIIPNKNIPNSAYKKRRFHKECVTKSMKENKKGFYAEQEIFPVRSSDNILDELL